MGLKCVLILYIQGLGVLKKKDERCWKRGGADTDKDEIMILQTNKWTETQGNTYLLALFFSKSWYLAKLNGPKRKLEEK